MTKADIIKEVAEKCGLEKVVVESVFVEIIESIKNSVSASEPVYLRGFGSFIVKQRAAKTARNITKGTTITVPAHKIPAFKPSKTFTIAKKK